MSAELVDPFATPERVSATDMCDAITYRVERSYDDPQLIPQLIQRTIRELRRAADDEVQDSVAFFARSLLAVLWHRAESGVPWGEPDEPAWSLDSERDPLIAADVAVFDRSVLDRPVSNAVEDL